MSAHPSLIVRATFVDYRRRSIFTEKLISSFGTGVSSSRNARLALLKYYSCKIDAGMHFQEQLLLSCSEYFKDFSTKVACFHDLQIYLSSLERANQTKLVELSGDVARGLQPEPDDSEVSVSSVLIERC